MSIKSLHYSSPDKICQLVRNHDHEWMDDLNDIVISKNDNKTYEDIRKEKLKQRRKKYWKKVKK